MKISKHRIEKNFAAYETINKTSGSFSEGLPDTIVLHYTAGPSASSAINTFKDPDVLASAHILVDTDGTLTQMIPLNMIAWHAGKSTWIDRTHLNNYSIGIEIVNAGRLEKSGNIWRSWFGKTYSEEEVIQATHHNESEPGWWHRYTEEQITSVYELCRSLIKTYKIRHILGHDDISPGRKIDPGPAFPMEKIRERLLNNDRRNNINENVPESRPIRGLVQAHALNIRSGPGSRHKTIAEPLSRNTELEIIDEQNGWYQVKIPSTGWVSKRFIKKVQPSDPVTIE